MIDTNGSKNGVIGINCGANDGTNGAEVPLNKEQVQIEKLLQTRKIKVCKKNIKKLALTSCYCDVGFV